MAGRIVVGVDGSKSSQNALEFAIEEARRRDAELEAVMAYRWLSYYPGIEYSFAPPLSREKVEVEAMAALIEATADVPSDVVLDQVVVEGTPTHVLMERAAEADLLIVGSRGHGGFAGLLLGSTSHQLASHAPCPVVVVR